MSKAQDSYGGLSQASKKEGSLEILKLKYWPSMFVQGKGCRNLSWQSSFATTDMTALAEPAISLQVSQHIALIRANQ